MSDTVFIAPDRFSKSEYAKLEREIASDETRRWQ